MGVNNGYDIGVNGRDLILKTSGKIYVKVADKFYELDFKNEQKKNSTKSSEEKQSDVVLLDTLTTEDYPGDNKIVINNDDIYITKGGSYKKINDSKEAQQSSASFESFDNKSDDLFIKISDNVWGFGKTSSGYNIEFLQDDRVKWNDYLFYNSVKDYFFGDVYGNVGEDEDLFWETVFFNKSGEDKKTWTAKSKSEIESTVLNGVYRNDVQVEIKDFSSLYNCFWGSQSAFDAEISKYAGEYAIVEFEKWSGVFSPKSNITIGKCSAIVTAVIDDSAIIKFKDDNVTLNPDTIQQTEDTIVFYEKEDIAFLDILNSDLKVYNNFLQKEDDIRVRLGNLSTLDGYSGIGSVFNKNVTIKNPPFILNSNGSGGINDVFCWNTEGELSGTFVVYVKTSIEDLYKKYEELSNKVKTLESNYSTFTNQYNKLLEKVTTLETSNKNLKQQYDSLLERIKKLEDKT